VPQGGTETHSKIAHFPKEVHYRQFSEWEIKCRCSGAHKLLG